MLPIDLATLSVIAVVGDLRVLADPERTAFRVEPNAPEHSAARPLADLFFGQHDAVVSISDAALIAVLAARKTLPKGEPQTDDEVLAEFNKLADELTAAQAERDALDAKCADLEKDLADARSRIPVVAPNDATPPLGSAI